MEVKERRGEDRMGRGKKEVRDGRGGGRIHTSLSKSIIIFCNSGSFSRAFILAIAWKESGGRREMRSVERSKMEMERRRKWSVTTKEGEGGKTHSNIETLKL